MSTSSNLVIITGARGGIGRALASQLHGQGWRVAAVGRDADAMADVPAHVRIAADTTTYEGAQHAIERCKALLGQAPTHLAHCVGSTLISPLHRATPQQVHSTLRINLDSALFTLGAWAHACLAEKIKGAAVLVSSVVGQMGVANHEVISAAKGGLEALARSAAATYAAQGLRINVVAPGLTETPMTASMLRLDAMREGVARQYPLGHWQQPEDIASGMAWLLSDHASRITGQVLSIDGGFTHIRPIVR